MVPKGLNELGIKIRGKKIVIKPNLIINRPYPVTTPPETVGALIEYFREGNEVLIAEGSGFGDTHVAYRDRGYVKLARRYGIRLVDLNRDEFNEVESPKALALKRFKLAKTLREAYLISAAVLKRHSLASVTLSLKNMLGATVELEKGKFHPKLHENIVDINSYKRPELAVIDGRLGLSSELGGKAREFGVMIFSEDPVAADAVGARILGIDPLKVKHLRLAQEAGLGFCDLAEIEELQI